jgi:hypothetical protein
MGIELATLKMLSLCIANCATQFFSVWVLGSMGVEADG